MKRIAANCPEISAFQYGNARNQSISPRIQKQARTSQPAKREDSFSAKNRVKTTSSKENSIEKVIGESVSGEGLAARMTESLEKGVPYTFVATKNGSKFSIRPDTNDVMKRFIEEEHLPAKKEKVYFCSFIESDNSPVLLGTPKTTEKTCASKILRSYLLQPQELEDNLQLTSRVLFKSLFEA